MFLRSSVPPCDTVHSVLSVLSEVRMAREADLSRRAFLAGVAALAATSRTSLAAGAAAEVPLVTRRVEKRYKIAGCTQPNDLQFVPDGLWVLDQVDPNKAFKVRPEDGSIIDNSKLNRSTAAGLPTATARCGSRPRK